MGKRVGLSPDEHVAIAEQAAKCQVNLEKFAQIENKLTLTTGTSALEDYIRWDPRQF